MATFVCTVQFTEKGMKDIKSTCRRADAFTAAAEKLGAQVKDIYWTLGPFDGLLIFDAPDDETATALILQLGSFGNVHTQTARAYQASEIAKVLDKLAT